MGLQSDSVGVHSSGSNTLHGCQLFRDMKEGYQIPQPINCPDEPFAVMPCAGPQIRRRNPVPAAGPVSHRVPGSPGGLCLIVLSQSPSVRRKVPAEVHWSQAVTYITRHRRSTLSSRTLCLRNAIASELSKTDLIMWNIF